jgi:hypothetical protein
MTFKESKISNDGEGKPRIETCGGEGAQEAKAYEGLYSQLVVDQSFKRASLLRHSLCNLNKIGDTQHLSLNPFRILTHLVSLRYSRTLTH